MDTAHTPFNPKLIAAMLGQLVLDDGDSLKLKLDGPYTAEAIKEQIDLLNQSGVTGLELGDRDEFTLVRKDVLHLATVTLGHAYHTVLTGQIAEDAHTSYQALDAVLNAVGYQPPDDHGDLPFDIVAHDGKAFSPAEQAQILASAPTTSDAVVVLRALNDWVVTYAHDFADAADVEAAQARLDEFGTLHYITKALESAARLCTSARVDASAQGGWTGEVIECGTDPESGVVRIVVKTTVDQLRDGPPLIFRNVSVRLSDAAPDINSSGSMFGEYRGDEFISEFELDTPVDDSVSAEGRAAHERDMLAEAIGNAAIKSGIYRADLPGMTGPQLVMACDDMATALAASCDPEAVPATPKVPCHLCDGGVKKSHTGSVWCEACNRTGYRTAPSWVDQATVDRVESGYRAAAIADGFDEPNEEEIALHRKWMSTALSIAFLSGDAT